MSKKQLHGPEIHETADGSSELLMIDKEGTPNLRIVDKKGYPNSHFNGYEWIKLRGKELEDWLKKAEITHFSDAKLNDAHRKVVDIAWDKFNEVEDALKDPLTELSNRKLFERDYARMTKVAKRRGFFMTVFTIDLNKLKFVNDTYGHDAGDQFIRNLALRLQRSIRGNSEDLIARVGGDEFAIAMLHTEKEESRQDAEAIARIAAEKFLHSLEEPLELNLLEKESEGHGRRKMKKLRAKITASIGVATIHPADLFDEVAGAQQGRDRSDNATYMAKKASLEHTKQKLEMRLKTKAPASLDDDTSACVFFDANQIIEMPVLKDTNNRLRLEIAALEAKIRAQEEES